MTFRSLATAALLGLCASTAMVPAVAQTSDDSSMSVPAYRTWQSDWNHNQFDHKHVILGTVSDFKPFRLMVTRKNGMTQTVDLKNGTVIFPSGMTPTLNQPVALVGYYSNGTFIANRVVLHQ